MAEKPRRVGRYELGDRVGRGGMGACYQALDRMLNRWVVVKILHGEFASGEDLARFTREARAAASLKHGNIVTIYDFGEEDGAPYIVMEFVRGDTLAVLIRRGQMPLVQALRLLEELCGGLAFAHRAGVVHRDVKPQNLMVDADGRLKILDFGIARMAGAMMTAMSGVAGTPGYMSPEQIKGESVDRRSDIFGVGAVAYELVSGCEAFGGETTHAIMNAVLRDDPPPLSEVSPAAAVLDPLVRRALHKNPEQRYQNADAFGQDLERIRKRLESAGDQTLVGYVAPSRLRPSSSRQRSQDEALKDSSAPTRGTPRRSPDPQAVALLRASQIQSALDRARQALAAADYESALEHCTHAATYNETHPETLELLERVRLAMDERDAALLLEDARLAYQRDDLSRANELLHRARALFPASREATKLDERIHQRLAELERLRQRDEKRDALARAARAALDGEDAEHAQVLAADALVLDPSYAPAVEVERLASARIEHRRREAEALRAASTAIHEARREFASGQYEQALGRLRTVAGRPDVDAAIQDLTTRFDQIRARQHQARLEAEREVAARIRRDEEASAARERDAAEQRRAEEAERRRVEEAERRRVEDERRRAEETERRRAEDERRRAEEAERHRAEEAVAAAMAVAGEPEHKPEPEVTRRHDRGQIEFALAPGSESAWEMGRGSPAVTQQRAAMPDTIVGSRRQTPPVRPTARLTVPRLAVAAVIVAIGAVIVVVATRPQPSVSREPIGEAPSSLPSPAVPSPSVAPLVPGSNGGEAERGVSEAPAPQPAPAVAPPAPRPTPALPAPAAGPPAAPRTVSPVPQVAPATPRPAGPSPQTAPPPAPQAAPVPAPPERTTPLPALPPTPPRAEPPAAALGQQEIALAAKSEAAEDLPAALEHYERALKADPSLRAIADPALARVRDQMRRIGAAAFERARLYETLGRSDDAIASYERAARNLPETDPNRQVAQSRLAALRPQRR